MTSAGSPEIQNWIPMQYLGTTPYAAWQVSLVVAFALHDHLKQSALIVALPAGVLTVLVVNRNYFINLPHAVSNGTLGALIANTAAVVGFGAIAKLSPAFGAAVDALTSLPGDPLVSASIAVTLIAGLTGSASGGQAIALPILAPHYLGLGVDANALHRVVAIASGGLDSLSHNGYVVTTIRGVCRETHKSAYWPMFCMTVIVPLFGLLVALLLL